MAANINKNIAPAAALLVLLPLTILSSMALAVRHPPVGESHLSLIPPFFDGPVAKAPPPPPATASAEDVDDASPLRKVPRGPNHSPNDPSPPASAVAAAKLPLLVGDEVASSRPIAREPLDGPKPLVEH